MTDLEQRKIIIMRSEGKSYNAIASDMNISINTVKTFCRRNRLGGNRASGSRSGTSSDIDLINIKNRGNSTVTERAKSIENTSFSAVRKTCKVKLTFAKSADDDAIPEVLGILMRSKYRQG
ncbi:MAG TPA: hypothetical protein GXZ86_01140 [Clostridiales bacterium]|nr:hypothetical protein [Clostridiales bacterium]